MPRYQRARVGVKGFLFRGDQLLLLRRRDDLDLHPGGWDLPGGGVEVGDGLEESLVREMLEETGFSVRVQRPIHAAMSDATLRSGKSFTGVIIYFECRTVSRRPPRLDSTEHCEAAWVSCRDLARYRLRTNQLVAIRKAFAARQARARRG